MLAMFLLFLLAEPAIAVKGARFGLMLWANRLLPSLLPFMILTQILIRSGYLDAFTQKFCISYPYFVLFSGTLFGFPMGCKLTVDLYDCGKLSDEEASFLFIITNQMSPAFVGGYILSETLHRSELIPITYLIFYGPSVLYGLVKLRILSRKRPAHENHKAKKSTSGLQMNTAILDAGIMNSLETMLKLGCYIMLFSILTEMCSHFFSEFPAFRTLIAGLLEVTGAVSAIDLFFTDARLTYIALLAATAFGGCSGIAQTAFLIRSHKTSSALSLTSYIKGRLLVAAVTVALALAVCLFL